MIVQVQAYKADDGTLYNTSEQALNASIRQALNKLCFNSDGYFSIDTMMSNKLKVVEQLLRT